LFCWRNAGVWYLIGLGMVALLLSLPRGIWGWLDDHHALQLLPVGYRLTGITSLEGRRPETDQAS
jgi:hypothetical protein